MRTDGEKRAAGRAVPAQGMPFRSGRVLRARVVCLLVLLACLLAGLPAGRGLSSAVAAEGDALQETVAPDAPVAPDASVTPDAPVAPDASVTPDAPVAQTAPHGPDVPVGAGAVAGTGAVVPHVPNFGDQPATEGARALYAEAVRVLSQVRGTRYTGSYVVDEESGRFELDCSGFLSLLLYEVNPSALATVDRSGRHYRPRAEDFHRSILRAGLQGDGTGWRRLERVSDLRPGDMVAWLRPAERSASSATGHVMVALGVPRFNPARPAEVLLPVADCTLSPHGDPASMRQAEGAETEPANTVEATPGTVPAPSSPQAATLSAMPPGIERAGADWLEALPRDTREPGIGGVGSGVIGLATDAAGRPVAYWWRGGVSRHQLMTSIMLGRLE